VTIHQPLSAVPEEEAKYLFDVGRRYRIDDPAIASLGRQMRTMRTR
jgi:hypothetical protein